MSPLRSGALGSLAKVIVYVRDMHRATGFYRDALGLTVRAPVDVDDYSAERWVELETGACTLALHAVTEPVHPAAAPCKCKLVFSVADIDSAHRQLVARGVQMGPIETRPGNLRVAMGHDPDGNPFAVFT
jgi:predicted enzyme related to lactoylglutathione lyase